MVATIQIVRKTGASGAITVSDITGINTRANAYDGHSTTDTTYPIRIPTSGTNYSYWVTTRLRCTVTPTGTVSNLKWYTDGVNSFGTGITCKVARAQLTAPDDGYRQAQGTPAETGLVLNQTNYTSLIDPPANAFGYTSAAPISVSGSISNPNTGEFGYNIVYQIEVASTASPGVSGSETFSWQYDET